MFTTIAVFVAGALVAVLAAFVNGRYQLKVASEGTREERARQRSLVIADRVTAEANLKRRKLRQVIHIVLRLSEDYSKSSLYVGLATKPDARVLDDIRMKSVKEIRKAHAIADVYVPEVSERLDHIHSRIDWFWIHLRNEMSSGESRSKSESLSRKTEQANLAAEGLLELVAELRGEARVIGEAQRNGLLYRESE